MSSGLPNARRFAAILLGLLTLWLQAGSLRAAASGLWAPFDDPWFDRVGVAEGLPHSVTTAIAQDRRGLIWIGTMGGLVRYDGYRMQVFEVAGRQRPGLTDAYVRSLLALPDGGMLIGTNAGGVVRFDPSDNSFHAYPVGRGGTSDRKIYRLADDDAGGVWIATDNGLDHLDLRSGSIQPVPTGTAVAPRSFSVLQDRQGNLWLGNNNGLFVRRAGTATFDHAESPDAASAIVLHNQIWAIAEDREGRLWAGSGQAGAAYRDADGRWRVVPGFGGYDRGARQPTVRDFLETSVGGMWIATDGNGVMAYTPGAAQARRIDRDPARPSSLPGDSVRALATDHAGNIWAATDLGAAYTDPNARTAFAMLPSPLRQNALADTSVRGVFVDSRGRIWLGEGDGHVDMIDLAAGRIRHLRLGGSLAHRDVQAFAETGDGAIWAGAQGLARIDPLTFAIHNAVVPALNDRPVLSLQRDGDRLLIGTYEGVFRYDIRTRAMTHFSHDPHDPGSLANDTVRNISRVDHRWWYATARGISVASDSARSSGFENLVHRAGDPGSLPQDYAGSTMQGPRGRLWVSTFGGIGVVDQHTPGTPWRFRKIGLAQGLGSEKVNAVLGDDRGNVWASLSNGIAVVDGRTGAVANLGTRDGLRIASYIHIAAAVAPGGNLLFGGLGGLTVIRPYWQAPHAAVGPLAITHAVLNGAALPFGQLPVDGQTFRLQSNQRNLRVDFSLLDYQAPLETAYSYRMDGLDDGWTDIPRGSLPTAIYTNLPQGRYRLQLRAQTHGMHPRTIVTAVGVAVEPRWYETFVARLLAVLLLIACIVLLVHLRTLYLRRQARQLQRQIDEHTRDLQAANLRLDELAGTDGLTGAYNRRRLMEMVSGERELAQGQPLCIALFDLDRFKLVNDTYGHLAGDAVLRGAIGVIRQHCRQGDLLGRYGGEEFVLCLPDSTLAQGMETAERIRAALALHDMDLDERTIRVTVSIGVAELRPGESIEHGLSRADKALYEAKHAGRNRCVAAG